MEINIHVLENNIYITDNSEIRDCWALNTHTNKVYFVKGFYGAPPDTKKIILTNDEDLIQDGIQPISNEFLQWFVKNPSCESVEVKWVKTPDGIFYHKDNVPYGYYKVIIPQEEPKQETLEQVAKKQWGNVHRTGVLGFIDGAKWQAQRMYSEEEVKKIAEEVRWQAIGDPIEFTKNFNKWFSQFKKQNNEI